MFQIGRAAALSAFFVCPYPGDPQPLLVDAKSSCEQLKEAAWRALSNLRHPAVRDFALAVLPEDSEAALPLLIKNYQEQDAPLLERLVTQIPVDFDETTGWHGIHLDVLNMVDDGLKAPAALLRHIYTTTYCSSCREHALRQMGKRRLLTDEILQECLFDSNSDICAYAERCLRRRKSRCLSSFCI